jgi:N-acetylglucosamine-6-sulfatase
MTQGRRSRLVGLVLVLLPLVSIPQDWPSTQDLDGERPNFVVIVTDDQDAASVEHMPQTVELIGHQGVTFSSFFVAVPSCCPSRASFLRGQYSHNHGVLSNVPPSGGFETFRDLGNESSTLAVWLDDAGYQTGLIGKYLNGYGIDPTHVPPGWDEWFGYAGQGKFDRYLVSDNGQPAMFDQMPEDYEADVYARRAVAFIEDAAAAADPFFLYVAPQAPHQPAIPAPRDADAFAGATAPRPPSFNEADVADKPTWVRNSLTLTDEQIAQIDALYRSRLASLLAVDQLVADVVAALSATGTLDNTYVVFTSDNGFFLGEHRQGSGKGAPYEEAIRVPFLIRGPGIAADTEEARLASNIDLAPTIAELAGATAPDFVDGRSLVPLLSGRHDVPWRQAIYAELIGKVPPASDGEEESEEFATSYRLAPAIPGASDAAPVSAQHSVTWDPPNLSAFRVLRTDGLAYIEYVNGERELYDMGTDPYQLENLVAAADPALLDQLGVRLAELSECAAAACRQAEDEPLGPLVLLDRPSPTILSPSSDLGLVVGETVTLSGAAVDAGGAPLPAEALSWEVRLHTGSSSAPVIEAATGSNVSLVVPPPPSLADAGKSRLVVYLTAIDPSGGRRTVARDLFPRLVDLTFFTTPPGLAVRSGGLTIPDGSVIPSWAGYAFAVDAPGQLDAAERPVACGGWSDGGPCVRTIATPSEARAFTATFAAAPLLVLPPVADTTARNTAPDVPSADDAPLLVLHDSSQDLESYLRFDVTGLTGDVVRATLWLHASDGSADALAVFATAPNWDEATLTWTTRPTRSAEPPILAGPAADDAWVAVDVTAFVTGDGPVSFVVAATTTSRIKFRSSESANRSPVLIVETA